MVCIINQCIYLFIIYLHVTILTLINKICWGDENRDSYNQHELTNIQLRYMLTIRFTCIMLHDCIAALLTYWSIHDFSNYHLNLLYHMSQLLLVTYKCILSCWIHCSLFSSALVHLERVKEYAFTQTMLQVGYDLGDQRYLQCPECLQHWLLTWYPQDLYPWGLLCHIQVQLQLVLVMVVSTIQSPGLHMDWIVTQVAWLRCIMDKQLFVWGLIFQPNVIIQWSCEGNFLWLCHPGRTDLCLVGDVWWWFTWCCTGEGGSAFFCGPDCYLVYWNVVDEGHQDLTGLLFIKAAKHQTGGIQDCSIWVFGVECTRWCSAVLSGVVELKDKFSLIDTWYIQGALLRGVENV